MSRPPLLFKEGKRAQLINDAARTLGLLKSSLPLRKMSRTCREAGSPSRHPMPPLYELLVYSPDGAGNDGQDRVVVQTPGVPLSGQRTLRRLARHVGLWPDGR